MCFAGASAWWRHHDVQTRWHFVNNNSGVTKLKMRIATGKVNDMHHLQIYGNTKPHLCPQRKEIVLHTIDTGDPRQAARPTRCAFATNDSRLHKKASL